MVIGRAFVKQVGKKDLGQHVGGGGGHRGLQNDNDSLFLTRGHLENNRGLECTVRGILDAPAIKFSLRIHCLARII